MLGGVFVCLLRYFHTTLCAVSLFCIQSLRLGRLSLRPNPSAYHFADFHHHSSPDLILLWRKIPQIICNPQVYFQRSDFNIKLLEGGTLGIFFVGGDREAHDPVHTVLNILRQTEFLRLRHLLQRRITIKNHVINSLLNQQVFLFYRRFRWFFLLFIFFQNLLDFFLRLLHLLSGPAFYKILP